MGILGKVTGKMVNPKEVKQKLADKQFQLGRKVLIDGLPACIRLGYKEQKEKGLNPTVDGIFNDISQDNLAFYHKMEISSEHIKEVIKKVIEDEGKKAIGK
jgi:hypothetical protein